jgi:hypothetical protein
MNLVGNFSRYRGIEAQKTTILGEGLDKRNSKAKIPEIPANLPSIAFMKGSASRIYDFEAVLAACTA